MLLPTLALSDGSRRITALTECVGMEGESVTMQDVFLFEKSGINESGRITGRFRATGIRPKFYDRLKAAGLHIPVSVFQTIVDIS